MRTVPYAPSEIREGAVILHNGQALTVRLVQFRKGRGLELYTLSSDGYLGPTIYPHPDEPLEVVYMPSLSEDDLIYLGRTTLDYPWATRV